MVPALTTYAAANGDGRTAGEVVTEILVDPDGPEAVALRESGEAETLAGPAAP